MSEVAPAQPDLVTELKVSAHLMRLEPGVYCVYHSEGSQLPDPATGLPGARLSLPPGPTATGVVISGFRDDGWIATDSASLIRVTQGPAHVLVTVYQMPGSGYEAPRMQVRRLIEGVAPTKSERQAAQGAVGGAAQPAQAAVASHAAATPASDQATVSGGKSGATPPEPEIAAHIQLRGDVLARVGEWIGDPGSQRWIEGFAVAPRGEVPMADIEYQAVLGRGWLSPWAEGGQYCGSRGMALPILGLRARLRGPSSATHVLKISATFTDGSEVGPVDGGDPCEADSLAPLEAFRMTIRPVGQPEEAAEPAPARRKAKGRKPAASEPAFAGESMVGEAPATMASQAAPPSKSRRAPLAIAAADPEPQPAAKRAKAEPAKPDLAKSDLAKRGRKVAPKPPAPMPPAPMPPAAKRGAPAKGRGR